MVLVMSRMPYKYLGGLFPKLNVFPISGRRVLLGWLKLSGEWELPTMISGARIVPLKRSKRVWSHTIKLIVITQRLIVTL